MVVRRRPGDGFAGLPAVRFHPVRCNTDAHADLRDKKSGEGGGFEAKNAVSQMKERENRCHGAGFGRCLPIRVRVRAPGSREWFQALARRALGCLRKHQGPSA